MKSVISSFSQFIYFDGRAVPDIYFCSKHLFTILPSKLSLVNVLLPKLFNLVYGPPYCIHHQHFATTTFYHLPSKLCLIRILPQNYFIYSILPPNIVSCRPQRMYWTGATFLLVQRSRITVCTPPHRL